MGQLEGQTGRAERLQLFELSRRRFSLRGVARIDQRMGTGPLRVVYLMMIQDNDIKAALLEALNPLGRGGAAIHGQEHTRLRIPLQAVINPLLRKAITLLHPDRQVAALEIPTQYREKFA